MKTDAQLIHYLLSFDDAVLIKWYNEYMVEPFGDFSEQVIRENDANSEDIIKTTYSLEILCDMMRNPKTTIREDSKYIAILGADEPFVYCFDSFEELTNIEIEHDAICEMIKADESLLDELRKMQSEHDNTKTQ